MTDYISQEAERDVRERPPIAQAIKEGEKSICWSCFHWEVCFVKANQPCIKCTRYIPSADVAPVVRCRECIWGRALSKNSEYVWCNKPYASFWASHEAEWYCADGKRKEDNI